MRMRFSAIAVTMTYLASFSCLRLATIVPAHSVAPGTMVRAAAVTNLHASAWPTFGAKTRPMFLLLLDGEKAMKDHGAQVRRSSYNRPLGFEQKLGYLLPMTPAGGRRFGDTGNVLHTMTAEEQSRIGEVEKQQKAAFLAEFAQRMHQKPILRPAVHFRGGARVEYVDYALPQNSSAIISADHWVGNTPAMSPGPIQTPQPEPPGPNRPPLPSPEHIPPDPPHPPNPVVDPPGPHDPQPPKIDPPKPGPTGPPDVPNPIVAAGTGPITVPSPPAPNEHNPGAPSPHPPCEPGQSPDPPGEEPPQKGGSDEQPPPPNPFPEPIREKESGPPGNAGHPSPAFPDDSNTTS